MFDLSWLRGVLRGWSVWDCGGSGQESDKILSEVIYAIRTNIFRVRRNGDDFDYNAAAGDVSGYPEQFSAPDSLRGFAERERHDSDGG